MLDDIKGKAGLSSVLPLRWSQSKLSFIYLNMFHEMVNMFHEMVNYG